MMPPLQEMRACTLFRLHAFPVFGYLLINSVVCKVFGIFLSGQAERTRYTNFSANDALLVI